MRGTLIMILIAAGATGLAAAEVRPIEPDAKSGRSLAVVVPGGALVHTAQVFPNGPAIVPTTPADQVRQAFTRLDAVLAASGSRLSATVKLNVYVSHESVTELVDQELAARFAGKSPPAVSVVQTVLPDPAVMVALDAVAMADASVDGVTRQKLAATLPDGPQVYISGQAEKGDGTLADATRQTMASLLSTLKFLDLTTADVVHIKAFLTPMSDAAVALKEINATFGDEAPPPVSLVEWQSTLPIEIELVAAARTRPDAPPLEFLTPPGMKASPVFCRVVRVNVRERVYVSGLFGTKEPNTPDEVGDLFATLQRALKPAGSDLRHLAKATYYVTDDDVSRSLNELRPDFYDPQRPPAASKAKVAGTGRPGRTITMDMIAVRNPIQNP